MNKYVCTAIPYSNARPHVGHALDALLVDVWARHQKEMGNDVRISAGLDEHGTKIEKKAKEEGESPQAYVDSLAPVFQDLLKELGVLEPSYFVRTTSEDHKRRVSEIWKRLDEAGVIYKGAYEGWYCSGCEAFLTESEAKDVDYVCADHKKPLEKVSEENYYLKVSKYAEEIREFVAEATVPNWRGKEVLELIKDGAKDVSISRPVEKLDWGIPVPGDSSQVMYVWVDALSNYITALGYPDKGWDEDFWPADLQVLGKDILRFHVIIWPAILLALGLPLPKKLLVHGHITMDGAKMSKSVGNVVDPFDVIEKYGTDAFRYFFIRHISTTDDGDFSWTKMNDAYNNELANELGNLVSRVATMCEKYEVSEGEFVESNELMLGTVQAYCGFKEETFEKLMSEFQFSASLEHAWKLVRGANKFIDEKRPWELAKDNRDALLETMQFLVIALRESSKYLKIFMPSTSEKILDIYSKEKLTKPEEVLFVKRA
jgi:methionyl-tRNA synthetase